MNSLFSEKRQDALLKLGEAGERLFVGQCIVLRNLVISLRPVIKNL